MAPEPSSQGRRRSRRGTRLATALVLAALAGLVVTLVALGRESGPAPAPRSGALAAFRRPTCAVSTTLVPSCGRWWGVAALPHTNTPLAPALATEEELAGRPLDVVHVYHTNDQLFPTPTERSIALQPGRNRLLLINWKPATDHTWRQVAQGAADARIDRLARYIMSTFGHRFFLTIWHEPENDVRPAAGSGYTAVDYAAMYRHVVDRLRGDRVRNAVMVMNYLGFDKWAQQGWFPHLWPGDSYVDWIGLDPYGTGAVTGYSSRDFRTLVDRRSGTFPGYYTWATRTHPGKPIMLCEWGVRIDPANPDGQARFFDSVRRQIGRFPAIKGLVYFDAPTPPAGQARIYLGAYPQTVYGYRTLGRLREFVAPQIRYAR